MEYAQGPVRAKTVSTDKDQGRQPLQQIVDNAIESAGVPLACLSIRNPDTGMFELKVVGRLEEPLVQKALKAMKKAVPDFDPRYFAHPTDVNPFIQELIQSGTPRTATLATVTENMVPRPALAAIQAILKVREAALYPLVMDEEVVAIVAYLGQGPFGEREMSVMRAFASEAALLIEHLRLARSLGSQVQQQATELARTNEDLKWMSKAAMGFVELGHDSDIYHYVAETVRELCRSAIVGVNSVDEKEETMKVRAVVGLGKWFGKVAGLLGGRILGLELEGIYDEAKHALAQGKLVRIPGGLHAVFFGRVPRRVCTHLERLLGIGEIYSIGLRKEDRFFGSITIMMRKGGVLRTSILEAFANQASVAVDRFEQEESLRHNEERLRILFEDAPDAYYLNDLTGAFVDGNKAAERLIGYTRDECVGRNFLKMDILPLEEIPKAAALLVRNVRGEATGPDELVLQTRNGRRVPVEIRTFPVSHGGRTLVLSIARDITDRKRAEEVLRFERDRLEMVTANVGAGIAVISEDYEVVWSNTVLRGHFGDVHGSPCHFVFRRRAEICGDCAVAEIFRTGADRVARRSLYVNGEGEPVPVQLIATPVKNDRGDVTAVLVVVIPLSNDDGDFPNGREQGLQLEFSLSEKLQELDRIKNEFVGFLARGAQIPQPQDERWLTLNEIAEYLAVKPYTIYKWIKRKSMPAHKIGGVWRFRKSEVDTWHLSDNS